MDKFKPSGTQLPLRDRSVVPPILTGLNVRSTSAHSAGGTPALPIHCVIVFA